MSIEKYINEGYKNKKSANSNISVDFDGVWKNGLNSEMDLSVNSKGEVKGIYKTGVGSPGPEEEFDLTGFVSGDIIGYTVNFGKYGSITSWVGQHTIDKEGNGKIYTLWHLTKNIKDEDEPDDLWGSILAGANTYFR
ncbi:avidin/streptavidin family protein [Flagellimonas onchidii]|uniref:avidin/streptavidin family protein n=1 Tax=Flagellimonas onchidii TaxID=2562684 RepID=UPI0010A5C6A5|nr:avidin/streptavidin family protein [Allomuricauda onchidii]